LPNHANDRSSGSVAAGETEPPLPLPPARGGTASRLQGRMHLLRGPGRSAMTQMLAKAVASSSSSLPTGAGLRVPRRFTQPGVNPLDKVRWDKRRTVITNPDGSVVFQMDDVEVPAAWSQLATDIMVSKYFRKAGVPETGHEVSVRQVVHRLAHTIRTWGEA